MQDLEKQLDDAFAYLEIESKHQRSIKNYMNILREKDQETYEHSIRVGLLGKEIAEYMKLDPKALFFPCLLHDIGKIMIPDDVLKKVGRFSNEDMEQMKNHPIYSYQLLKGIHEFSAEVALRHHKHQKNGYPQVLPASEVSTKLDPDYCAILVSIADFYDKINMSKNDRYGELSGDEIKRIFIEEKPDQKNLIEELYSAGIFGKK
jgi:putative nucleotidyltransferase with HDIG domain